MRVKAMFRAAAEESKRQLSSESSAMVYIPGVLPEGEDVDLVVTREMFQEVARPFIVRAMKCVETTLKDGKVAPLGTGDVVLLVGGSSKIPLFRSEVGAEG